jgi:glutamate--cysteine ligase regulatory subunit
MYVKGQVLNLGIAEFGIVRLKSLLPHVKVRPVVDQINLRDSCDVPHHLLEFAKTAGIRLMPHMDKDNPLPKETLQEVLDDLGISEQVAEMRWVVKYTAIVKERGVLQNKGYFLFILKLTGSYVVSAQIQ